VQSVSARRLTQSAPKASSNSAPAPRHCYPHLVGIQDHPLFRTRTRIAGLRHPNVRDANAPPTASLAPLALSPVVCPRQFLRRSRLETAATALGGVPNDRSPAAEGSILSDDAKQPLPDGVHVDGTDRGMDHVSHIGVWVLTGRRRSRWSANRALSRPGAQRTYQQPRAPECLGVPDAVRGRTIISVVNGDHMKAIPNNC
jgi:hypothetical protein